MRRIVCGLTAALAVGAAGCGGSKKAELPANAQENIGKPVVVSPAGQGGAKKDSTGLGAD